MIILDQQTAKVTASYLEPVTSSDGSPLTDLAYTNVYYTVQGGAKIVGAKTVASNPAGGGTIVLDLIVPAPQGGTTALEFWATATDLSGNESFSTQHIQFPIERLAPSSPTSFIVA